MDSSLKQVLNMNDFKMTLTSQDFGNVKRQSCDRGLNMKDP